MKVYAAVQFLLGDEVGRPISKTQYDLDRIGASMTEVLADDLSMLHPSAFDRLLANRFPLSDWFGDVRCIAANANRNAIFVVLWTITSTLSNDGGAAWAIEPAWFEDVAALSLRYLDRDNGRFAPGTCPYGGKETVLACDLLNFAGYAADCKSMKWPETLPAEVRRSVHAQLDESAEGRKLTRQLAQMRLGTSESKEMLDELAQHIFVSSEHRSSQVALDWWPGAAELLFERLDSPDSNQRWSTCHVFRTMGLPLPCGAVRTTGLTPQERYSLHEAIDKASAH